MNSIEDLMLRMPQPDLADGFRVSEAYGAVDLLLQTARVRRSRFSGRFADLIWQHGWNPDNQMLDAKTVMNGLAPSDYTTCLVARNNEAKFLESIGLRARAIGLPFAYSTSSKPDRFADSVLVLPQHSSKFVRATDSSGMSAYAEAVAAQRDGFSFVVACLHEEDFIVPEFRLLWHRLQIPVILGAAFNDRNSLNRMRYLFESFDFVTGNDVGSFLPYAAYSGARVSVNNLHTRAKYINVGDPGVPADPDVLTRRGNSLIQSLMKSEPWIFCQVHESVKKMDWGAEQIGLRNILKPNDSKIGIPPIRTIPRHLSHVLKGHFKI